MSSQDSLNTRRTLDVGSKQYDYFSLPALEDQGHKNVARLPFGLKVLLENLLRYEDGSSVTRDDIMAVIDWPNQRKAGREIAYRPARVLMQDFTGVPAVVDLAAMREAMDELGGDPQKINPISAVDLVIDHSVMVDEFGSATAFSANVKHEFERNRERYEFLRWGQQSFDNFRVVPPGTGICHQVNLEYLGRTIWSAPEAGTDKILAYPDTLVGTDSHTTMINALGILGWGVGGIEAEAAMLGQPISMLVPEVIGVRLTGELAEGATATDLVLAVTQMLRAHGVVGKFVEFFGDGIRGLSLADRATISNMAPEYGATCGLFPIDSETLRYLEFSGRPPETVALVEAYAKEQGMWYNDNNDQAVYTETLQLDLGSIEPAIAGPKRPQDKIALSNAAAAFEQALGHEFAAQDKGASAALPGDMGELKHGSVVIAAITSCTNTSNPSVMIGAGLVARKARQKGLSVKPWVKTSLAPGSQVVSSYLEEAGLQDDLNALGFNLVGYGCTTCIGNSGPLSEDISKAVVDNNLVVCSVLSGNRNFEGRINPHTKANYLASPPLVMAYALAGTMALDLTKDPIGQDDQGQDVYLKDIWPTSAEIADVVSRCLTPDMFKQRYANVFDGTEDWQKMSVTGGQTYDWQDESTYIKLPPLFQNMKAAPDDVQDIKGARALAVLGDSVTTDHISPAGSIAMGSPAGNYLQSHGVERASFNSYGARRGNHEVMMRGTFANIRIKNEMLDGVEGGLTKHIPTGEEMTIFEAAMQYQADNVPLIVVAGKEYGTGSSRDWAAKGPKLLGLSAVVAESYERIHRSNLIGMGILPLQFIGDDSRLSLSITGNETFDITGLEAGMKPKMELTLTINYQDGHQRQVPVLCRIDTGDELGYYRNGGILHYVLRNMMKDAA